MTSQLTHTWATQGVLKINELINSGHICLQCIELKNQLKETVKELKSARLIIELLQQESSTKITSNHVNINRYNTSFLATNHVVNSGEN
jgi:hypothetical protein